MPTLKVENLRFEFPSSMDAEKYDDWVHYQNQLKPHGKKAVDITAMRIQTSPATLWLIEVKDFRVINQPPDRANLAGLVQTVADKAIDTMAGMQDAAAQADSSKEKTHAARAIRARAARIVLHLEPHEGRFSKLFPRNLSASVLHALKQRVRNDPSPLVLSIANTHRFGVPWSVS